MTPSPSDPIRVLIVDDHHVVRLGLRSLLSHTGGFRVVGEAGSVAESVQMAAQLTPDVVLMDIRLPDGSGVDACRRIKQENDDVRVVMLTSYSDEEAIVGSVMAGASGYLLKQADAGASELEAIVAGVLDTLPEKVTDYRAGKVSLLGMFTGQVMRAAGSKADPKQVQQILKRHLEA